MKTIKKIFLTDVKHIFKNLFVIIIAVGVCFLPALYAWCNIYSNWDPYSKTGNLKMAVISMDEGYTDEDGLYRNVGNDVLHDLHKQDTIDWQFVDSKEEAIQGVKDGTYYGAVVISKDFTYKMYHVFVEDIDKPQLVFYQNQKKNAVANKISDSVIDKIENNINKEFIKAMATEVFRDANDISDDINEEGGVDGLISQLEELNGEIRSYQSTINVAVAGNSVLSAALNEASGDTVEMRNKTEQSQVNIEDSSKELSKTQVTLSDYSVQVNATLDTVEETLQGMITTLNEARLSGDIKTMSDAATNCSSETELLMNQLNALDSSLSTNTTIGTSEQNAARETIKNMTTTLTQVNATVDQINNEKASDAIAQSTQDEEQHMADNLDNIITQLNRVQMQYNNSLKPQMDNCIDSLEQVLTNADSLMHNLSSTLAGMGNVFSALQMTVSASDTSLQKTSEALGMLSNRITEATDKAKDAKEDDKVKILLDTLSGNPDIYGEFFAEPVEIKSEAIYPVDNYGSAVTPFFTVLAIWVGVLILVAILKAKPNPKVYPNARRYQMFFGRYALFFTMSQIQSLIIVIGDLCIFHIQCLHPFLFWLAAAATSMTFSILIYALVVAFGDVGKAIAVVIVVIQIAGSSGTYPIELLPEFFQRVYIFFPFPYAIDAMRECIAGMYQADYVIYLLELSIFILLSLVLGLWIQKPFEQINHFMEKRMEDTEMM